MVILKVCYTMKIQFNMISKKIFLKFSCATIFFLLAYSTTGQSMRYYDEVKDIYKQVEIIKPLEVEGSCPLTKEQVNSILYDKDGNEIVTVEVIEGLKSIKIAKLVNQKETKWMNYKDGELNSILEEKISGDTIFTKRLSLMNDSERLVERGLITKNKSVFVYEILPNEYDTIVAIPHFENNLLSSLEVKHGTYVVHREKYDYLEIDENGNWTTRIRRFDSQNCSGEIEEERILSYKNNYTYEDYFEIVTTELTINDDKIFEEDIPIYENLESLENVGINNEMETNRFPINLKEFIYSCFHERYYNMKFYFEFHTTRKNTDSILSKRLFEGLKVHVWDYREFKVYNGRTDNKRWFDEHYSKLESSKYLDKIIPTGRKKMVSGYECLEYAEKVPNSNFVNYYYVAKELPFINYATFHFHKFDGFIMASKRFIPAYGEVILTVDIKPTNFRIPFLLQLKEAENLYGIKAPFINKK